MEDRNREEDEKRQKSGEMQRDDPEPSLKTYKKKKSHAYVSLFCKEDVINF